MTATTLARLHGGLRSYGVEGKSIGRINFYRDGKVVLSTGKGWLERVREGSSYSTDVNSVRLEAPMRRAVIRDGKPNLTKGGHFYAASAKDATAGGREQVVYLDASRDDFVVGDAREIISFSTDEGTHYKSIVPVTGVFDGERQTILLEQGGSYRFAPNAVGEVMAKLSEAIKAAGLDAHAYAIRKLATQPEVLRLVNEAAKAHAALVAPKTAAMTAVAEARGLPVVDLPLQTAG